MGAALLGGEDQGDGRGKVEAVEQFDRFIATFQPERTDDLKPGAEHYIGQRCEWEAAYVIEEGPYEGQMACMPVFDMPFAWTPECDLADIEHRQYAQSVR